MSRFLRLACCLLAGIAASAAAAGEQHFGLGRPALPEEVKAWDIDVRPDGQGLPPGKGTVAQGEKLFLDRCASCHGEFGEGAGRWPQLAGGAGTLKSANPDKTIGSYWPYLSTVFDYIHRAMPFGDAQSLTPDETYALVAFLLNMNDVVPADFELSDKNFTSIHMPNEKAFYPDDRTTSEKAFWNHEPCMKDCKTQVKVTGHAGVLDVTPEQEKKGGHVD
jgi:S-disulfanyl-L-cysteine oxidoreductase SoxD